MIHSGYSPSELRFFSHALPPAERAAPVPTVQQRTEEFYYSGKWQTIYLNGPPQHPHEYQEISDIQLNQHRVGITAHTEGGIVEDLWEIVWENNEPNLQFKGRLASGVESILVAKKMQTLFGDAQLIVETDQGHSRLKIERQGETDVQLEFRYKKPTNMVLNAKWAAVAWEGGEIFLFGKDEYASYERTYRSARSVRFMLLDEANNLLTLSDEGLIELWRLPNPLIGNKMGGRFNQATLFKGPFNKSPMDSGDFEQVQGTINQDGQLCFIGRKRHGNRIFLHVPRPLPPELLDGREGYRQAARTVVPSMSLTIRQALFSEEKNYINKLEKEVYELRSLVANAQSEKVRAIEAMQVQIQHVQALAQMKRDLETQVAQLTENQSKQAQTINEVLSQFSAEQLRANRSEKQNHVLNNAMIAARMQDEMSRGALIQLQKSFDAAKSELEQAQSDLELAAAKNGCDPVTYALLEHPVAMICGHVFNQSTITRQRAQGRDDCPCCRAVSTASNDRPLFIERKED